MLAPVPTIWYQTPPAVPSVIPPHTGAASTPNGVVSPLTTEPQFSTGQVGPQASMLVAHVIVKV
jgi:hypothetical protein